jgi:hypothetical protein
MTSHSAAAGPTTSTTALLIGPAIGRPGLLPAMRAGNSALMPPFVPGRVSAVEPPHPAAADVATVATTEVAEAAEFDLVVPAAAVHDVLAEPLHDLADRLERIAGRLRSRATGEPEAAAGPPDPLELLLTGFVLGYISQPDAQRRQPRQDAG